MHIKKTIGSFLLVLFLMPLGHALMIMMEHFMAPTVLHYSAFLIGFVGLVITIAGVFQKGDTRQTLFGMTGAMLFWTGWVEFLMAYYAQRYGTHCDLIGNGVVETITRYVDGIGVEHSFTIDGKALEDFSRQELKAIRGSRPEYLTMPSTFGMWVMFMVLYVFSTRSGCNFITWIQKHCGISNNVELRPMAHHSSIVMFMEWNVMMWGSYLLLMFCYDPVFLGTRHPVTLGVGMVALIGSILMLRKQLRISQWGRNLRYAYATVIIFWTFVEVMARNGLFNEIWVAPMEHIVEMSVIVAAFVLLIIYLSWNALKKKSVS